MGLSSVLPFLANLKKQIPDLSGGEDSSVDMSGNVNAPSKAAINPSFYPEPMGPPAPPPDPASQPDMSIGAQQPDVSSLDAAPIGRAAQPKLSKVTMLWDVLRGAAQGGLAGIAQNAQTYAATGRNAGFGGGFFGATQLPLGIQREQLQNQDIQSQIGQRNAQTRLLGQSVPITLPNGQQMFIPATQAGRALASQISGQYGLSKQDMVDQTKMATEAIEAGRLAHLVAGVNPSTQQPGMQMLDKQGNSIGWVDHSVVPGLMAHTSSTVEYREDGQGNLHVLPKTTVTAPVVPGQGPAQPGQGAAPAQPQPGRAAQPGPVPQAQPGGVAQPQGGQVTPQGGFQPGTPRPAATPGGGRIVPGFQGKAAADMGFAYDQNNQLNYVSRADANNQGLTGFQKVAQGEVDKEKSALRQMNDVQINKSRYADAAANYAANPPANSNDGFWLAKLVTPGNGFGSIGAGGFHLTLPASDVINNVFNSDAYKNLSPQGRDLMDGYLRTMAAIPAYQKALSGIGRTNKEMLDLELANIPSPLLGVQNVQRKLDQFQENIDRASEGFPRFPGMQMPTDVRRQYEKSWTGGRPSLSPALTQQLTPDPKQNFLNMLYAGTAQR